MSISIIIPAYNAGKYMTETAERIMSVALSSRLRWQK